MLHLSDAKLSNTDFAGGAGGIRTRYLFNAIEALSQLSYSPDFEVCSADLEGQTPNQKIVAQG